MIRAARLLTNLLRWRRYTKERHGLGLLCGEILSDILLPVARGGWEVGGGDALRKASSCLFFFRSLCLRVSLLCRLLQQFHQILFLLLCRYV
jgi:hypothetical protein